MTRIDNRLTTFSIAPLLWHAAAHAILACALCVVTATVAASDSYPPPRFTDPARVQKLESAWPEIDRIFAAYAASEKIPGMVWGVVIDGRLAHFGSAGVRDRASGDKITNDTAFRIASMTKSFTALAILKLRDEGKLSLEDPVAKWIPEFAKMERQRATRRRSASGS